MEAARDEKTETDRVHKQPTVEATAVDVKKRGIVILLPIDDVKKNEKWLVQPLDKTVPKQ